LAEELGFDCPLAWRADIVYRADVGAGLVEHERVEAYIGRYEGQIRPNPDEVSACRAVSPARLAEEMISAPDDFAPWLIIYVRDHSKQLFGPGAAEPC
jgi:isopentenyl-diphosphate delta-isomerase